MTSKSHKNFLSKIKKEIEKNNKNLKVPKGSSKKVFRIKNENPDNCTLKISCPLIEKDCKGCWYDKTEIEKRKDK